MKNLLAFIDELENQISNKNVTNARISKSDISWQIDHSLLVINSVVSLLKKSDPNEFKAEFNLKRWIVFTSNYIPRGKVKVPKQVKPESEATTQDLIEKIALAKNNIAEMESLNRNHFYKHPFFNDLNVKQTKKFLKVHTFHHLKIIRDLVKYRC